MLVSFIVLTMNRRQHLPTCLSSISAQTYTTKELIVVDNGSTDGTETLVKTRFPQARLLTLSENQGVAGGRNRGIEAARGAICVFLDDDSYLTDLNATGAIVDYFSRLHNLAVLSFEVCRNDSYDIDKKSIPRLDKKIIKEDYACAYYSGGACAIRRDVFGKLGMYWEPLFYSGEELDLAYRIVAARLDILHTSAVKTVHVATTDARPAAQNIYYYTRNRPWLALCHLPWLYFCSTSLLWWSVSLYTALRERQLRSFGRALRDCSTALPDVLKRRKRVPADMRKKIASLKGRTWY